MKKLFLLFGTITIMSLILVGCGDKDDRLSEEEINARVDSIFMVESAKLTEEMTLRCVQRLESEVSMRADQLVIRATTDTVAVIEDATVTTDITTNTATTPTDADMAVETEEREDVTDDQIIRERVDERLANLRTELEMQCEQELMASSRTRADSILNAQGSQANLPPARKQTGTNTGKTTPPVDTRPGTKEDIKVNERPGTKNEEIKVNQRPGVKNPDPQ